jgi:hypothetical protein
MTSAELKQLRQFLSLSVRDAAIYVAELQGHKPERSWQRWEDGTRSVPSYVVMTMQMLALTRIDMLSKDFDPTNPNYNYYPTFEEFKAAGGGGNELKWKIAQSVSSQLICEREAEKFRQEEIAES